MKAVQLDMARRRGLPLVVAMLFAAYAASADVPGKITKINGQEISGGLSWKSGASQYEVATGGGGRAIVPLNQVAKVEVAPPAGMVQAIDEVRRGATSGPGVDTLTRITDDYLMLDHDLTAMRWVAEAHLKRGEGKLALERFNRVMQNRQPSAVPAEVVRAYWNVLLEAERFTELRDQLKTSIERGPRPQAASALMLRGEMDMRKTQYRDALVGGYLRTIVLYADIKDVQPEALSKAAKCFDELGESQNAEKMRRRLSQEYPDSAFAK